MLNVDLNDSKKQLSILKTLYTFYKCTKILEVPLIGFEDEELVDKIKQGFLYYYYYFFGNERNLMIGVNPFIKLLGK